MPTKPTTPTTAPGLQPWLHDLVTTLSAPTTALSEASGQIRGHGAQGVLHCDIRVLSVALLRIDGEEPTPIGGGALSAGKARFTAVPRGLGGNGADPAVRVDRSRTVRPGEFAEEIALSSVATETIPAEVTLELAADLARIETVRAGRSASRPSSLDAPNWGDDDVQVTLSAPGAEIRPGDPLTLKWAVEIPAGGTVTLNWNLTATTDTAPVTGVGDRSVPSLAHTPTATADDPRLPALLKASWSDLTALRMAPADDPDAVFLAAGSPWYFTLFGRDSLWAARFLLPFGTDLAEGTLRALAARQGTSVNIETAEEPGKIPHELRSKATELPHGSDSGAMTLPPLYYGTIDATPLWICLLYDAWRWGMPETVVQELLPSLEAALGWLRDYGDADGDGFLEYLDRSGHGLANQGWKDSADSVRFADGTIATGPVALCEVQGYAHEAALRGATLLDHFGRPGGAFWREWALRLNEHFREAFWVSRSDGLTFPALALDGLKRPVDALTSNIGHLLGTGLLSSAESSLIASLLAAPALSSGYGLRTMATTDAGYAPLSYHCGSVWAHDTAIALHGLARSGLGSSGFGLIEGLLTAASGFGYRLPELYSGDSSGLLSYPAACCPQAWSAAAIGPILQTLAGLSADNGTLECVPPTDSPFGALHVTGIRFGADTFAASVDRDGHGRLHS